MATWFWCLASAWADSSLWLPVKWKRCRDWLHWHVVPQIFFFFSKIAINQFYYEANQLSLLKYFLKCFPVFSAHSSLVNEHVFRSDVIKLTGCLFLPAVGPVLGLIFVPMIGSASDSLQSHFGRRRPFIWMLSLGVVLSLQIIPQAWHLAVLMSPQHPYWLEAALQAGAVCLMDFCGHVSYCLAQSPGLHLQTSHVMRCDSGAGFIIKHQYIFNTTTICA